jgi:hypothetical protein
MSSKRVLRLCRHVYTVVIMWHCVNQHFASPGLLAFTGMFIVSWANMTGSGRITLHWGAFMQPLLKWTSNKYYIFWVCVCNLRYPACNAHAPYCPLWSVRFYNIFSHYLIKGTIFEKKIIGPKICFDFRYIFFWNISHSKKNWARYDESCILVFM